MGDSREAEQGESGWPASLAGLNGPQRAAVLHGDEAVKGGSPPGPLIVLAGPGTGKTRVITHRIAHMVLARGMEPESIVGVTYTVKAAEEMKGRLAGLVGGTRAERLNISTLHGLGLRILQRFGDMIGLRSMFGARGMQIEDSAQRKRMAREVILRDDLFAHRRRESLDGLVEHVEGAVDDLENHGQTAAGIDAFVRGWRARLESGRGSDGRDLDEVGVQAERVRLAEFVDLARLADGLRVERQERGVLSFSDLITLPIRLLRDRPGPAAILRDEWRAFVVDEFQDVNAANIELIKLLAPPSETTPPDLCVVGDDDQAIYGFRGADDRAFAHFDAAWPGARKIELVENHRSEQPIIDLANWFIGRTTGRFAPDKEVRRPEGKPGMSGARVEGVELSDVELDGEVIAAMIKGDRAEAESRGVAPRPFCKYGVIVRKTKIMDRLSAALRIEGIPCRVTSERGATDDDGVKDVLAWMELLSDPRSAYPATRVLTRPPMRMPTDAALALMKQWRALRSREEHGGLDTGSDSLPDYVTWLGSVAVDKGTRHPHAETLSRLAAWRDELLALSARSPADDVVERIISLTGVAHVELLPGMERARRVAALVALLSFARRAQANLDPPGDIRALWSYYQDLSDSERALMPAEYEDPVRGDGAEDENGEDGRPDAVQIITAHKAKGLEWDTVFVAGVQPVGGFGGKGGNDRGMEWPPGLADRAGDTRSEAERAQSEERRVFYVACTRAERRLVLLSKKNKTRSKSTHYFEEVKFEGGGPGLMTLRSDVEILSVTSGCGAAVAGLSSLRNKGGPDWQGEAALDRARSEARIMAAEALERVEQEAGAGDSIESATDRLRQAAARLAVVEHLRRHEGVPDWAGKRGVGAFADALALSKGKPTAAPILAMKLMPPLRLSFTYLDAYRRCPRCFYLRQVLGLPERTRAEEVTGKAIHGALELFFRELREAEGGGGPAPGIGRLAALGRQAILASLAPGQELDPADLKQILAQLRGLEPSLHETGVNILEVERGIEWEYRPESSDPGAKPHSMRAKIDRIDRVTGPDGCEQWRIVDYKTGMATKPLTEPKSNDLQLGIYALALRQYTGAAPDESLEGTAEYWLLATGQRGRIDLGKIDEAAVRAEIDGIVASILAGRFEKGTKCYGDCDILGP